MGCRYHLHQGDCLEVLRTMPDASVDAVVTDPPYGLAFMGKKWDYDVPSVEIWEECLRVLKPGGHLLAFAGTRTQHRMAVRIEDVGFEIRDLIAWVYGSGFPKSHDISKAIDKMHGAEREVVGERKSDGGRSGGNSEFSDVLNQSRIIQITAPATDDAKRWEGWGTALKPALEPITVARKPFKGTVAANVLEHGTGALNIDGCRVAASDVSLIKGGGTVLCGTSPGWDGPWKSDPYALERRKNALNASIDKANRLGRWPANLIHDGSDEVLALFPETSKSVVGVRNQKARPSKNSKGAERARTGTLGINDNGGSAARYFYCAKASKKDRDDGLDMLPEQRTAAMAGNLTGGQRLAGGGSLIATPVRRNVHPTVKPTDLMRYLCRLVTQPGGVILDPFTGSGSTGKAAILEGFRFIGIEREPEYVEVARARIEEALK